MNISHVWVGVVLAVLGWIGQTLYSQVHENNLKIVEVEEECIRLEERLAAIQQSTSHQ